MIQHSTCYLPKVHEKPACKDLESFFIIEETGAQRGELLVTQLELGPWSSIYQFSSVYSLSCVWLFVTPWTAACQASLSITNSQSPHKPMSIELVMPSNHLILCCPILLLPSSFPASGSFPMSQLFASGGQSIGVSGSPQIKNIQQTDKNQTEGNSSII